MDTSLPPIGVGEAKTDPPFKGDLGKQYFSGKSLYRLVKAAAAIAAGSQGKQLATEVSGGVPTFVVDLNTTRGNFYVAGAIPSTLTGAIAASAYFLALVAGHDDLVMTSTAASAITSGSILIPGTASDLVRAATGVAAADIDEKVVAYCGFATEANTGAAAAVTSAAQYRSPIR